MVAAENPDSLFIAIGSEPILPTFSASGTPKLSWAGDVDLGLAETGQNVVIVGAGFTGLETALALANEGKSVKVIDMLPEEKIGADGIEISMIALKKLLKEAGVSFQCGVKLVDVTAEGAVIETSEGRKETLLCDTVVLSLGVKRAIEKIAAFDGIAEITRVIGDSSVERGGTLYNAVRTAFDAVMEYLP